MRVIKYIALGFIVSLVMLSSVSVAEEFCPIAKGVSSLDEFKKIPILDQGRIKPLDSYARSILLQFSGKSRYEKKPAIEWFASVVFDPTRAREFNVFLINNPQILESLGIEVDEDRRYSFSQLEEKFTDLQRLAKQAAQIDEKERDIVEADLIRIYENVKVYSNVTLSFAFVLPHPDFTIQDPELKNRMGLPQEASAFSYLDIALNADVLQKLAMPLERLDQSKWTQQQHEVVALASNVLRWSMIYRDLPVHIIPSYNENEIEWLSPWDAMLTGLKTKEGRKELLNLKMMLVEYWNGRGLEFDLEVRNFVDSVKNRSDKTYRKGLKTGAIELVYNSWNPFLWGKIFYFATFIVFAIGLIFRHKAIKQLAWLLLLIGFGCHFGGMAMRIAILKRPPVSNLYETFLFVGIISVMAGFVIEKVTKNWLGIAVASISGYIFLNIAAKFSVEGDTLQVLVAVLDSNFWLATHVTTITVGYAGTCVAGIVGHIYLLQLIFKSENKALLRSTYNIMLGTLGFGLTFAFLGTNLGGIWADQSWGRFWGWDPKENGALMIILWTAIIFHAKIGRMIGPLGVAVMSILGNIVVMWAWFGVNLLSVGLHSYGFTSGLATNLLIYFLCQLLFLTITIPMAKSKLK